MEPSGQDTDADTVMDALIDSAPTVVEFQPGDQVAQSLISDLAVKMRDNPTIAARYGLTIEQLYAFVANPEVRKRIKMKRAIWESDDNIAERSKAYFGVVALEGAPILDKLIHDPATPPGHVLKAFEVAGRFGGLETKAARDEGTGGPVGAQFSVVIQFAGSGKIETIEMPSAPRPKTIEGELEAP